MKEQLIVIDESIPPSAIGNSILESSSINLKIEFIDLFMLFKAFHEKLLIIFANIRV
ncbi:hypothetical protein [Flavobacterium haoranii]|uniref:Uncharacterized protein n=1 Tax=Flavobacterium haoranii TaxID=683124 RepID=A0A1M6HIC6_9FLAO|nr:hypothetical protein [Flavobacterium haoranii]SHJ21938.1 hypothetical protein SAMN05444337_1552 [Flavobacterium haoranii]